MALCASPAALAAERFELLRLCSQHAGARRVYLAEQAVVAAARVRAEHAVRHCERADSKVVQPAARHLCGRAASGQLTAARSARREKKLEDLERRHRARRHRLRKILVAWRLAVRGCRSTDAAADAAVVVQAEVIDEVDGSAWPEDAVIAEVIAEDDTQQRGAAAGSSAAGCGEVYVWTSPSTGVRRARDDAESASRSRSRSPVTASDAESDADGAL